MILFHDSAPSVLLKIAPRAPRFSLRQKPGDAVGRGDQHRRFVAVAPRIEKKKIMKIVPRHAVLGAHPAVFGLVAGEEAAGAGDVVAIGASGKVCDHVDVEIVDAFADIFPTLAAVEAAHDAAMFEA